MTVTVRVAEKNEYAGVARLARRVHALHAERHPERFSQKDHYLSEDVFTNALNDPDWRIIVAIEDCKIIGMAYSLYTDHSETKGMSLKGEVTLYSMGVAKDHRRQGVGKVLLQAVQDWAIEKNADAVKLSVHSFNNAAMDLYLSDGFTPFCIVMTKPVEKAKPAMRLDPNV